MKVFALIALALVATAAATCAPAPNAADFTINALPPGPLDSYVQLMLGSLTSIIPTLTSETPITLRATSLVDAASWNAIATFHASYNDAITGVRPVVTVPANVNGVDLHTSSARLLTAWNTWGPLLSEINPASVQPLVDFLGSLGITIGTEFRADVEACFDDQFTCPQCLRDLACANDYSPEVVGAINARVLAQHYRNDGWNMDGSIGADGTPCTANCRPFSDTTGYVPRNNAGSNRFWRKWQPLLEDDGQGFYFRQQHVTPHIGFTAKPRVVTRAFIDGREAPNPRYRYSREADDVIERLRTLTDYQKMEIEHFDNKILVAITIINGILAKYPTTSYEQLVHFITAYTATEHDAVLMSWKEKVNWDRVRPTTIIQSCDDEVITTWAGPHQGVKSIKARDFQPYIRVMPHSEYVSGSGCLCQGAYEFSEGWLNFIHGDSSLPTTFSYPAGSSKVEPGTTPANQVDLNISSLLELRNVCGQSRLNGGMHFTASVTAAYELCEGMGVEGVNYAKNLVNNTPF